jgi:hypothetical protein
MHNNHIQQKLSRTMKEIDMHRWKYDIQSYHNTKKMRDLANRIGRDTKWYDDHMQKIRDRWPNIKTWD